MSQKKYSTNIKIPKIRTIATTKTSGIVSIRYIPRPFTIEELKALIS